MTESSERSGEVFCPGCGRPNAPDMHFCTGCGAPLTPLATMDPLGSVLAEGYAARRAIAQPTRPIIAIGVWLWMLPFAILALMGALWVLAAVVDGLVRGQFGQVVAAFVAGVPVSVLMYISWTMLYRVTRGYLRQRGADSAHRSAETEDETDTEPMTCLACGQPIPAGGSQCPACNWSYQDQPEGPTER